AGYTQVTDATRYSPQTGYGWLTGQIGSTDRAKLAALSDGSTGGTKAQSAATAALNRAFDFTQDGVFAVDLPNGTYSVTVTMGDAATFHDKMGLSLEGILVDTITSKTGQFVTATYTVAVTDGQLTVGLKDLGGTDPYAVLNALTVTPLTPAP